MCECVCVCACVNCFCCRIRGVHADGITLATRRRRRAQWDGLGYETYSASTTDMVHFDTSAPTLAPGQPGVVFSPRAGRPPINDAKPVASDFDFGGAAFIGPLVEDYNVTATRVLQRAANDSLWYAYFAQRTTGLEPPPGADGFAASTDGLNWRRAATQPFLDVNVSHGAKAWESGQIYAPFLAPTPAGGALAVFYNAVGNNSAGKHTEESGQAYLDGGAAALPGIAADGTSLWRRDAGNPTLPNNALGTTMASDPKIYERKASSPARSRRCSLGRPAAPPRSRRAAAPSPRRP